MKAHTTGTASELFTPTAERHAAGVREHPATGAKGGAAVPDFAGELARAFVPETAVSAEVPAPAAMTRPLDGVATPTDRQSHESAPVADESSQTKPPSGPHSRPVASVPPSDPVPSGRDSRPVASVPASDPVPSGPLSRPRERVRERADLASAAPVVPRAPAARPEPTASIRAGSGEPAISAHEAPSTEIPAPAASDPSSAVAVVATPIAPKHEPIAFVKREPVDSPRAPEPDASSAEPTAPPGITVDSVLAEVAPHIRAHDLAPGGEHAFPSAFAAPPVPAHVEPAGAAPVAPADAAPAAAADFAPLARAESPPTTAPVTASRMQASREPQAFQHETARPAPRVPASTNGPIPNHAERRSHAGPPAAPREAEPHSVTTSPSVGRPLTVEHEPATVENAARTVAHEPASESVPTVRAPSQADAPHASPVAPRNPSLEGPASVERDSTNEVGPDPRPLAVDETPVLIARPGVSRAAAIVRGHSARASYHREHPATHPQPAIAPRSSHVEAAPRRTVERSAAAANIPATRVPISGRVVATTVVGPAPVLRAPVEAPAPAAVAIAASPNTQRSKPLSPERPVQSGPAVSSDPISRPRERVRESATRASDGARPALTPPREESPRASQPSPIPSPPPAGGKIAEAGTRAPRLARSAISPAVSPQRERGQRRSPSLREESPSPLATPPLTVAAPTSPVVAASTRNGVASGAPPFVLRRPATPANAAPMAEEGATEDTAARASKRAPSTDLPVQARASDKAPPANTAEKFTKVFGTPAAGDKSESPKPAQLHPATVIGHSPAASVAPHRPAFDRAAPPPLLATAPASQSPAHPAPSSRRERSSASDSAAVLATPHASFGDRASIPAPHLVPHAPAPAPFDAVLASLPPPAPLPPAPSALMTHAAEDPSLRATVMPERAVLSIDTGGAGELALHLRVKDGVADVRVSGPAAHTVDMRPAELRAALASEGLTLGSFQSGQPAPEHNHGPERADDDPAVRAPSRAAPADTASSSTTNNDSSPALTHRGLHVTA